MTLTLVTAPTVEPITADEAKLHLRVFHSDEDALITALIVAARQHVEAYTHRALISQTWDYKLDVFPCGYEYGDDAIWLPNAPLLTSTAPVVTYQDTAGVTQTWASSNYTVDAPAGPHARKGRIFRNYQTLWPVTRPVWNAVTVRFLCGYGPLGSDVPEGIKAAMKLLIGHWYANRELVVDARISDIPMTVDALLWPFKSF